MALALLAPRSALSQTNPEPVEAIIEIEQAPGSEACPDKDAVFRSIKRLFPEREFHQGSTTSESAAKARVTIRPLSRGHEAVLTLLPPRRGERIIVDEDESCRGLSDALALAFVMLVAPPEPAPESLSADETNRPDAANAPAKEAAAETKKPKEAEKSVPVTPRNAEPPRTVGSYRAGFGASFVAGYGVLSEPSLGAGAEGELFHERGFGLSLQGLRLWAKPSEAEGGSVTLTLWSVLAGPCYRLRLSGPSRLDACLRFGIGAQYADVQGFVTPESGNFPWQVLVPSLGYRYGLPGLGGLLSGFVRVGFVGQLRPQSFSVRRGDGSGETLEIASAPKFGVIADLGLMFGTGAF